MCAKSMTSSEDKLGEEELRGEGLVAVLVVSTSLPRVEAAVVMHSAPSVEAAEMSIEPRAEVGV